jgi:hypothetical protein
MKLPWMGILWPAFLMAGVVEMVVFAMVDPQDLHGLGGAPIELSASAVYSLAFFFFWAAFVVAGVMMAILIRAPSADQA